MAITIDWPAKIITVPKADMVEIQASPNEIRQLDLDAFRRELRDLEDDEGMPFDPTHEHNTTVTVAGAVLARVVQIINSYTVTFEDGQYAVSIVGGNSNVADVVNVNQVSVRPNNSVGLQDLNSLQAASFNGGAVALAPSSSYDGTTFPVGTRQFPVNNWTDAIAIAVARGLTNVEVMESLTIPAGTNLSAGYNIFGDNPVTISITVDELAAVHQCEFRNVTLAGYLDMGFTARDCRLMDVTVDAGVIQLCGLNGDITLTGTQLSIFDSWSNNPDDTAPSIDMGGSGKDLVVRNHSGALALSNHTGAGTTALDFLSGRLELTDTITAGTFILRGLADLQDSSSGTTVTDYSTFDVIQDVLKLMKAGRITPDGKVQLTDELDAVFLEAPAYSDVAGVTPHTGSSIRRTGPLVPPA